jgi:tetratricopeptide (TPR) repeat protein
VPAAGAVAAVALALSFTAPWFAERHVDQAIEVWQVRPERAFDRLDTAAAWNPLGIRPKAVAGAIALRLDRPRDAERYYRELLDRSSRDPYAHLALGALAFDGGRRAEGMRLLRRAAALEPRDELAARALRRARRGARVDINDLNRALLRRTRQLGQ